MGATASTRFSSMARLSWTGAPSLFWVSCRQVARAFAQCVTDSQGRDFTASSFRPPEPRRRARHPAQSPRKLARRLLDRSHSSAHSPASSVLNVRHVRSRHRHRTFYHLRRTNQSDLRHGRSFRVVRHDPREIGIWRTRRPTLACSRRSPLPSLSVSATISCAGYAAEA